MPGFTHGQLYVALSRATSPGSLKNLIDATDENGSDTTNNVVFADFIDELVDAYGDCIETVAEVKHIEYFGSVIQLQSCYKISGYICTRPRTYMATVDHAASLVIGQKARFDPVRNPNIPTVYFRLHRVRREELPAVYEHCKRAPKNAGREVEITLWPEMRHLIGYDVVPGDIVAISSTMVTEHNELRALPPMPPTETHDKKVTILDLNLSSQQNIQSSRNFICEAQIKEIHEDRGWYYVLCSKCSSKLFPEQDNSGLNFVCKDDDGITPIFRYSVNATIVDVTGSAEAVFFNESMQALLNISCKDMVTEHADTTNPKIVPHQLRSAIDKQSLLYLTLKNDGKIDVNNASEVASTTSYQLTGNLPGTSTFTLTTPVPKSGTSKRQLPESPDKKSLPFCYTAIIHYGFYLTLLICFFTYKNTVSSTCRIAAGVKF
ncbi:hypothetical protein CASFOL_005231 [Castilleja foliolosa]|uniref:Replication factor A C-terminal domain-containing protein n=1 Tax=Castilleja foliolosa TaxID=1961234 RepID=A0ABD3E365_9LAMI